MSHFWDLSWPSHFDIYRELILIHYILIDMENTFHAFSCMEFLFILQPEGGLTSDVVAAYDKIFILIKTRIQHKI